MSSVANRSVGRRTRGRQWLTMAAAGASAGWMFHRPAARAATYVFDPSLNPSGGSDGSGAFNTTTADFYNTASGTISAFGGNSSSDIAVFGSGTNAPFATYTVTTSGTLPVEGLVFNSSGYNISGTAIQMPTNGQGFITTNASSALISTTFGPKFTNTAGAFTLNGTGALTLTGGNNVYSGVVTLAGTGSLTVAGTGTLSASYGLGGLRVGVSSGDAVTYNYATAATSNLNSSTSTLAPSPTIGANGGIAFLNQSNGQFDLLYNGSSTAPAAFVELGFNGGSGSALVAGTGGLIINSQNGGTPSANSLGLRVGDGGFGTLVVNTTAANASNAAVVGNTFVVGGGLNAGGIGQATFIQGAARFGGAGAAVLLGGGASSVGTLNLGTEVAGTATITDNANGGTGGFVVGSASGSVGVLNLNGGTVALGGSSNVIAGAPSITGGAGTGTLNLNGVTLAPGYNSSTSATSTLIAASPNLTTLLYNGGLTVNTNYYGAVVSTSAALNTSISAPAVGHDGQRRLLGGRPRPDRRDRQFPDRLHGHPRGEQHQRRQRDWPHRCR